MGRLGNARLRNTLKRTILGVHRAGARFGVTIMPAHYYTPVPNIVDLEKTRAVWAKKSDLPGIEVDLEAQGQHLLDTCLPFQSEYGGDMDALAVGTRRFGPGFGYIETQALHAMIRALKPARIIEVGSGVSTYCMVQAASLNQRESGQETDITAIEPNPSEPLRSLPVNLIDQPVQTVDYERFQALSRGDLLFIDSTHTVKAGGDVNFLILEVLPRLQPGVVVHFHDIYLPYDYQRDLLETFMHWSETSLLRAFLINNPHARILFSMSQLHYDRPEVLKTAFPDYAPQAGKDGLVVGGRPFDDSQRHFPSSTYIEIS
jgi:hypothetical protein